ncbi:nicotinate phosphoribosyltransferase [Salipiger sp. IMCC34102]|nr:nicotinate phosphoribosyltransferase [Salipiger sp. IMCC34102]RYH04048.1 nicotinate phosphoribosyltransferase [Salipiger sp. IMCC34102]
MPKRFIYVLIPLGFVAIIAAMIAGGVFVQETTDGPVGDVVEGEG